MRPAQGCFVKHILNYNEAKPIPGKDYENDMTKQPMEGIYTPNITPVDAKGRVDEETLCAYVDWLIERGVHGLYPNGSTGEFTRFTAGERRRIIEVLMQHVAGRVPRKSVV